jgi:hypothetical protein
LGTFWLNIEQFWQFEEISIKLGKRRMKFKKSSPLKLLSQSQPNFAEMILGWSPFKIVSVSAVLYQRWFIKNPVIYVKKLIIMLI